MNRHLWLYHRARDGSAAIFFLLLTFSVLGVPWIISFVYKVVIRELRLKILNGPHAAGEVLNLASKGAA